MKLPTRSWRSYSTFKQALPAKVIRNRFLEYFTSENDHQLLQPSSLLSNFDSSIPFTRSGAYQLERVLLGDEETGCNKAASSQKCIQVEGKYDDLKMIGLDPHHHMFFEMLGNWSFGSYGKKEACKLAWDLLTSAPYNIPPHKLFVTYFGGDEKLNLPADAEVRDIWLELGVHQERIRPFGKLQNFWEMNETGPCGTSTKIHVALTDDACRRPDLINPNNSSIVELWNITFIKYSRTETALKPLSREFINTGMGFERLVSVLHEKNSSFNTELYEPLFSTIEKITGAPKYSGTFNQVNHDQLYRRFADFSRLITVSITNNVFPDLNWKLKHVLRKAFSIAVNDFKLSAPERLIIDLSRNVAESLQDVFPEVGNSLDQVKLVVESELNAVNELIKTYSKEWNTAVVKYPVLQSYNLIEHPTVLAAHGHLLSQLKKKRLRDTIPAETILSLSDRYKLHHSVLRKIASSFNLATNWDEVESLQPLVESGSRSVTDYKSILQRLNIKTDDSSKHKYFRNDRVEASEYVFPDVKARLLVILQGDTIVSVDRERVSLPVDMAAVASAEVKVNNEVGLIFDQTNFACEGGSNFDKGYVVIGKERFAVTKAKKHDDYVVHYVRLLDEKESPDMKLRTGLQATLQIDAIRRLSLMRNNTLSLLVLATVYHMCPLMYVTTAHVTEDNVTMRIRIFGMPSDLHDCIRRIQENVDYCIRKRFPVESTIVPTGSQLLNMTDVVLQPGMKYPYKNIRVVSIGAGDGHMRFREPSDAVQVLNTADVENALINGSQKFEFEPVTIRGVSGNSVETARQFEMWIETQADSFELQSNALFEGSATAEERLDYAEKLSLMVFKLKEVGKRPSSFFTCRASESLRRILQINRTVQNQLPHIPRESLVWYFKGKLEEQAERDRFAVYFFTYDFDLFRHNSFVIDIVYRNKFPSLFFSYYQKMVKCVCHVPECCVREDFNAQIWLESVLGKVNHPFTIQDDVEKNIFCFLKNEPVQPYQMLDLVESLLRLGKSTAAELLK